jgi:hypothetical protein
MPDTPTYSFGGELWRNTLTGLSGGLIDVMGISQHNREIKAAGGSTGGALLSALGAAGVAGQNQFFNSNGSYTGADAIRGGAISEYIKKYMLQIVFIILGVALLLFVALRKK